ncbi:hypothetical protein [Streptomyces sp. NPDC001743]|uniref:hypothetical protein n=1 Tax=Streptomyces sp. NPDC001743 TaxID=3154397 RepID=UPI003331D770
MDVARDDWRDGGPRWLMRCLGRYLGAFLVLVPLLSLLLPAGDATGVDGEPTYGQGVTAAIFVTWLMLMLLGIWALIVLLILVGLRGRMDATSFRGLAGFLLCLPLFLMPLLGGHSVTLIYFIVHVLFAAVFMPTTAHDTRPLRRASRARTRSPRA